MDARPSSFRMPPRSVAIVFKPGRPDCAALAECIRAWLLERGVAASCCAGGTTPSGKDAAWNAMDLVLALGGDGTVVGAARSAAPHAVPVLGINFGRVGFLAEIQPDEWEDALGRILREGVLAEPCLALRYTALRDGEVVDSGIAVNDIVISRSGLARLVGLDVRVDGFALSELHADGLIVSTPTGSTGYAGSAGGPLIFPGLPVYAVTPICPFLNNFQPLVLKAAARLSVAVGETGASVIMTVDGQEMRHVQRGDTVNISSAPDSAYFARVYPDRYYRKLRESGFAGNRP